MQEKTIITSPKSPVYRELRKILQLPIRSDFALVEGYNAYKQLIEDELDFEVFLHEDQEPIEGARYLSSRLFSNVSKTKNSQGIICKVAKVKREFDEGPVLLLDRVQDPGNVGTLLRSAHAFGINNVLLIRGSCSVYNDKVLRSSMAAVFNLAIEELASHERVKDLVEDGYELFMADSQGDDYRKMESGKIILALGNESQGLDEDLAAIASEVYSIPMTGSQESLNVAVAGSILMCQLQDV